MSRTEAAANTAIFHRQMNFSRAVHYVMQETGLSERQAQQQLQQVMLWYRG